MADPVFFHPAEAMTVASVAAFLKAEHDGAAGGRPVTGVATLAEAGPNDLTFLDNPRYAGQLAATRAAACLLTDRHRALAPPGTAAIVVAHPHAAFVSVSRRLFPQALRPQSLFGASGVSPGAIVHPLARLESGVTVDPGAVVGPGAEIGAGTIVAAGAAVGPGVRIGRDCAIGPGTSVVHALIGNRVILHAGVRIGQDGFGFEPGRTRHAKIPQVGRVIIQDDVEIGANTTVDRGHIRDTVIGEGTKIDNLVQIAHNCRVGQDCLIAAQSGLSGSVRLGDRVVLGGQVGIADHLTIGDDALLAGSGVAAHVPPGEIHVGNPAVRKDARAEEILNVKRLPRLLRDLLDLRRRVASLEKTSEEAVAERARHD